MGIQPAMHTTISRFHGSIWQHSVRLEGKRVEDFFFDSISSEEAEEEIEIHLFYA
jgi:hypothetical protein